MNVLRKLVLAAALVAAASLAVAPAALAGDDWGLKASASTDGSAMRITATFSAPPSAKAEYQLNTEVHSASGKAKQWFETVEVPAGKSHTFSYEWTASGTYTVKLGVFDSQWNSLEAWNNEAAEVTLDQPATTQHTSFWGVNTHALDQSNEWRQQRPHEARLMERLATTPTAQWFGNWTRDVRSEVSSAVSRAEDQGATAVLVAYNIVGRDCSGYSSGGSANESDYNRWINDFAAGIHGKAVVVLEPDALAQLCGDPAERYRMLANAARTLDASGADVYIDAGHSNWIAPAVMAERLSKAGIDNAAGFAVNVSNFYSTAESERYAEQISSRLDGARYVVDTSRNGNGSSGQWCNPWDATVGRAPTTDTSGEHADAYLWIKNVGDSDGYCNDGPAAGQWSPAHALSLVRDWR